MATDVTGIDFRVETLRDLYNPDMDRIERAKKTQAALFRNEKLDHVPVITWGRLSLEQEHIPEASFAEEFFDADKMLCNNVRAACGIANSHSDAVPSMRVNFGAGICLSLLGLEQEVFPDKMPWLTKHLSKQEASRLTPDDIKIQGSFERALEFMERWKKIMGDRLPIYCLDTQGPFDLAHLLVSDELLTDVYLDPPFIHHVMEICLEIGIKAHRWIKHAAGEPEKMFYHRNAYYAENIGIRICEDTASLLGPDLIDEFCLPYTQRLAEEYGGAFVHYCGRNDYLTEKVSALPMVRALNFGHVPGKIHDQGVERFISTMESCEKNKIVYAGDWPRFENESTDQYIQRLHHWAAKGCMLPTINFKNEGYATEDEFLRLWNSL